jgi:hypothetical protein
MAGWTKEINEISTMYIEVTEAMDFINFEEFKDEFDSIEKAGGEIQLTGNLKIDKDVTLVSGGNVTINTDEYRIVVDEYGLLKLKGKVKITGNGNTDGAVGVLLLQNGGDLQMTGGKIEATASNGTAVYAREGGRLKIQSGTISSNGADGTAILLGKSGNADIAGGNLMAESGAGTGINADGEYARAVISGGVIAAENPK